MVVFANHPEARARRRARTRWAYLLLIGKIGFCASAAHAVAILPGQVDALRSAWMQRASGRMLAVPSRSTPEIIDDLRVHFRVVERRLLDNEKESLALALARLESLDARSGRSWTSGERQEWLAVLRTRRAVHVARLREYRERGLFPLNEGRGPHAVPIFVDHHGTDCAVGYLMRASGEGALVDEVARTHNLVFVSDIEEGPILDWVARSGITREEAALIQPSYEKPRPPVEIFLNQLLLEGASFSQHGLRIENVSIVTEVLSGSPTVADPQDIGWSLIDEDLEFFDLDGTHLLFLGRSAIGAPYWATLADTESVRVTLDFDITTEAPDTRIRRVYLTAADFYNYLWYDFNYPYSSYNVRTVVSNATGMLGSMDIGDGTHITDDLLVNPAPFRRDELIIPPQGSLHLQTEITLAGASAPETTLLGHTLPDGQVFSSFQIQFLVAPDSAPVPALPHWAAAAVALALLVAMRSITRVHAWSGVGARIEARRQ